MIMDKLMTYHSLDIQWETTMCCGWGGYRTEGMYCKCNPISAPDTAIWISWRMAAVLICCR